METASGKVIQRIPEIYQESRGVRKTVRGAFRIDDNGDVRFDVGNYDPKHSLVIDPTVTYSNYIGGSGTLTASQMTVDSSGSAFLTGTLLRRTSLDQLLPTIPHQCGAV
jgi:hypothetical protein